MGTYLLMLFPDGRASRARHLRADRAATGESCDTDARAHRRIGVDRGWRRRVRHSGLTGGTSTLATQPDNVSQAVRYLLVNEVIGRVSWCSSASDLPQDLLERIRLHLYIAAERVVEDADHVQYHGDQYRQASDGHGVQPVGFYPEEIGKGDRQRSS
jgi:hypothetical protein